MDYRKLDKVRNSSSDLQLDAVEAFAKGSITRRQFIQRAAVLGLSLSATSAVLAACGAASPAPGASTAAASPGATSTSGRVGGTIRIAAQRPAGPIDPVAMSDNASYNIATQTCEYLAALGPAGTDIAPGLATKWTPNADGSEWTFELRKGVKWHDGKEFLAADVVATMDRLVAANNSGLRGVLPKGGATAPNSSTVVFKLTGPNGNFPYLVSAFNYQTVITPADYKTGTLLTDVRVGTGAWKLERYDASTGARFIRNENWWGGKPNLDAVEFMFFDAAGPMVTAVQGGQADVLTQFDVLSGSALLSDASFEVRSTRSATHRQVFMRTDKGQFADKRVRQALALSIDRPGLIQALFRGRADLGNDHVIAPVYPFFDPNAPPQRAQDIAKARQLLEAAGATNLAANIGGSQRADIPDMAVRIQSDAAKAGIRLTPAIENQTSFYNTKWCPPQPADPPCSGAIDLGIIDYSHRPTPDVFLNAALGTRGVWNASQYSSQPFEAAFKEYQRAVTVDAQKAASTKIQTILNEDVPVLVPYFYQVLSGFSKKFTGVVFSPGSLVVLSRASLA